MRQVAKTDILSNAVTATSSYTGNPFQLAGMYRFSVQVKFSSGTLNGTLQLQASDDPAKTDWIDITGASQAIVSGASHMWNVTSASYQFTRFTWIPSSGSGTLTAYITTKWEE